MNYTDTFSACELLIRKHAKLWLKVGDFVEKPPTSRIIGKWRPAVDRKMKVKMQALRRKGMTVGDIARKVRVSWNTALKHSRIS